MKYGNQHNTRKKPGEFFFKVIVEGDKLSNSPRRNLQTPYYTVDPKCGTSTRWLGQIHRTRPRDPHLLKKQQDRPSNPHRVLSLWWSNHLDLRRGWRHLRRFLCHALTNLLEHGGATWQHDRNVRIHADVTSHFMMLWKEVPWNPLAIMPMKLAGKNTRAKETFGTDSEGVSV